MTITTKKGDGATHVNRKARPAASFQARKLLELVLRGLDDTQEAPSKDARYYVSRDPFFKGTSKQFISFLKGLVRGGTAAVEGNRYDAEGLKEQLENVGRTLARRGANWKPAEVKAGYGVSQEALKQAAKILFAAAEKLPERKDDFGWT